MKRIFLVIYAAILSLATNAQSYDEINLIGEWTLTKISGKLPLGIESFSAIVLGDAMYEQDWDEWKEQVYASGMIKELNIYDAEEKKYYISDVTIEDFFISNSDKLHIAIDSDKTLRFIIKNFTSSELVLQTYDQSCEIELRKDANAAPLKKIKKGDVNEDGNVDISDIVKVINIIALGDEDGEKDNAL